MFFFLVGTILDADLFQKFVSANKIDYDGEVWRAVSGPRKKSETKNLTMAENVLVLEDVF